MTMYQPGIPTGLVNLDEDYQNIQDNFQQLDTTYGKDHVPYSQAENNGYHNFVRLVPNATPAQIPGIGQLFDSTVNDGIDSDTILYFKTGDNKLLQLTRNFVPVATTSGAPGYTFLPGGLILQWGVVLFPGSISYSVGNTNFNQTTANVFSIQTNLIGNSGSGQSIGIVSATIGSPGTFQWRFTGSNSSSYTGFYWTAVTN